MHKSKSRMLQVEKFVQAYVDDGVRYSGLAKVLENSLKQIVSKLGMSANVSSRVKHPDNVREKIILKNYTDFSRQLQDLVGVRVVTLYDCDVDTFVEAFKKEFHDDHIAEIVFRESGNKKNQLRPNQFGYLSSHVVFKIVSKTNPWGVYTDMFAELQVRSSLQNGWADVSHSIDYKESHFAPPPIRRRLHAISALLEIADNDFDRMRAELDSMAKQYQSTIRSGKLHKLPIDALSVSHYLKSSHLDRVFSGGLMAVSNAGKQAGMSEFIPRRTKLIDGTALSRLILTLNELEFHRLDEFHDLLGQVLKDPRPVLRRFVRAVEKFNGVFHADPVDILTVLISAHEGARPTKRGFRRDFDWSGPFLSKPTKEVMSALRSTAKLPALS